MVSKMASSFVAHQAEHWGDDDFFADPRTNEAAHLIARHLLSNCDCQEHRDIRAALRHSQKPNPFRLVPLDDEARIKDDENSYLTPKEVANCLKIGRTKVQKLLSSGDLPSVQVGRNRRVSVRDFEEFIAKQKGV
jgi:excisionase family DNA binding protein